MGHHHDQQDELGSRPAELPRLRDSVAFLAQAFAADNIPKARRVVFNYDGHAGRPRDRAAYALARRHGIRVKDVHPVDVPFVRPVADRRPVERSAPRSREQRSGHGHSHRGPPSDDEGSEPPASAVQRAHRSLLPLTRRELRAHIDIAQRRLALLEVTA